jgi:hypothetical protein
VALAFARSHISRRSSSNLFSRVSYHLSFVHRSGDCKIETSEYERYIGRVSNTGRHPCSFASRDLLPLLLSRFSIPRQGDLQRVLPPQIRTLTNPQTRHVLRSSAGRDNQERARETGDNSGRDLAKAAESSASKSRPSRGRNGVLSCTESRQQLHCPAANTDCQLETSGLISPPVPEPANPTPRTTPSSEADAPGPLEGRDPIRAMR